MNTNEVTLSLATYNTLRDFQRDTIKENTLKISRNYSDYYRDVCDYEIWTQDKAVKELGEANKSLTRTILDLEAALTKSKIVTPELVEDLKRMSIWKFLKWRKSK